MTSATVAPRAATSSFPWVSVRSGVGMRTIVSMCPLGWSRRKWLCFRASEIAGRAYIARFFDGANGAARTAKLAVGSGPQRNRAEQIPPAIEGEHAPVRAGRIRRHDAQRE